MINSIITNITFENRTKKTILEILRKTKSSNQVIDLNNIIPIPNVLKGFPVNTISYFQLALFKYEMGDVDDLLNMHRKSSSKSTLDGYVKYYKSRIVDHSIGQQMYDNLQLYGVPSWREFIKKEWGVGDNCVFGSTMFNNTTVSINTLVQYPRPIIKKLSKMFPDDILLVKYASDSPGKYSKCFRLKNGRVIENVKVPDKRITYCELFKKNPHMFKDILRRDVINDILITNEIVL
jgi:hypothetical protein